jgi:glycosyltransferase involved in cell wall biosynthesis
MFLMGRLLLCAERRRLAPDEQIALCDRVLSVNPNSELALRRKASVLVNAGRRAEALQVFTEATHLHPNNLPLWRNAAQIAARLNYAAELNQLILRGREYFGDGSADSAAGLAAILEAAGKTDEAAALAEKGLDSAKHAVTARQVIVRQSVDEGNFSHAWPHLLELQKPADRPIDLVRLYAQVAAGFSYVQPTQAHRANRGGLQPIEGRFPDIVFQEAVQRTPILSAEQCRNVIFEVTSTLAAGGAERQVALTCQALAKFHGDLKTELVAEDLSANLGRDFFLPRIDQERIPVRELRDMYLQGAWRELLAERPDLRANIRILSSLPMTAQRIALPLYVLLVQHRPQIVHLWQDMIAVAGGLAAVLAGIPRIVLGTRSTRPVEIQRARPYFRGAYIAMLQRPGVSMIGNSENGARDYEEWLGLPLGSVGVIPNACDFEAIRANASEERAREIRRSLGISPDAPVLGGVMRCSFEKRPELWTSVAIELARHNPRFHGLLVGDGPMMRELLEMVRSVGLAERIHFVGRKTPVEPWMQAMDVLFLSSKTEGLPNVLIEGQALGVAVSTMRVGGAPEAVSEGRSALVLDEASPAELADQLGRLLGTPQRRTQFAAAGPAFIREKFSAEAIVARIVEEFRCSPGC